MVKHRINSEVAGSNTADLNIFIFITFVIMTPISADVATEVLKAVGTTGNYIITSLVAFAAVFLAIAGIRIVLSMIGNAINFHRG